MSETAPVEVAAPLVDKRRRRKGRRAARRKVQFIVAGVQKAGTSTLLDLLSEHPQIGTGRIKELHFFDGDRVDWSNPDYTEYHLQFRNTQGRLLGEATPSYIFWPGAMERIHDYDPGMRIILSFRDPIARAFSHWCMMRATGKTTRDFGAAIRATRWSKAADALVLGGKRHSYVARGFYGAQLQRVQALFPSDQLLLLDYHQAFASMPTTLDRLTDFLGVDKYVGARDIHRRSRASELAQVTPTAADIVLLAERYQDDLELFAKISGMDVSDWPTARVLAGTLDPETYAAQFVASTG